MTRHCRHQGPRHQQLELFVVFFQGLNAGLDDIGGKEFDGVTGVSTRQTARRAVDGLKPFLAQGQLHVLRGFQRHAAA